MRLKWPATFPGTTVMFCLLALLAGSANAITLKIATLSPDGSSWMNIMRDASQEISEKTAGRVEIRYYPGGVMGNDQAVFRKIRARQLQGAAVTGGSLASFYSDSNLYNMPFVFNNLAEVDYVRERMDAAIIAGLAENGWTVTGIAEGGMAYIMSQQPIRTPEDLARQKLWIPADSAATLKSLSRYDIKVTTLALPDVLTGLQSGLINTITSSPMAAIALQWHTQVKYITQLPLAYFYGAMAIENKAFARLSTDDQTTVREVFARAFTKLNQQNRADNRNAMDALLNQGVELVELTPDQTRQWLPIAKDTRDSMLASGELTQSMVDRINTLLGTYRQQQAP